jgi:hypothetical protein
VQSETGTPFWRQWWRVGGIFGLIWVVLFIVGAIVLQGETPSHDDSAAEIREYFVDDSEIYLVGDYLTGLGFILGLLPFFVVLRRVLGTAGDWAGLLSRIALFAGALAIVYGGAMATMWGTLAFIADNPEVDDSTVVALFETNIFAGAALSMFISLFLLSAGLSIWLSGVIWRWVGPVAVILAILGFIGGAWPIDGDPEGALGALSFAPFVGVALFVLVVSIALLLKKDLPMVAVAPDRTVV